MRKIFAILSLSLFVSVSNAEIRGGVFNDGGAATKRHQFAVEASVGRSSFEKGTVGFTGGLRYQYNINRMIGLDLFGVNYSGHAVKDLGLGPSVLQGLVGLRWTSPNLYQDISFYLGGRIGGGYDFYLDRGGFASDINIGIKILSHITFGYVLNVQLLNTDESFNWGKYNLTEESYNDNYSDMLWSDLPDNVRKARLDNSINKYIYHGFKIGFIF